jgi:hypothetical protein
MLRNLARSAGYFATAIALPWFIGTAAAPAAQADETYSLIAIVQLPLGSQPLGSTDIAWVNHHTYGLTDRSNQSVDIINTRKNDQITLLTAKPPFAGVGVLRQSGGPNGVVIVGGDDDDHADVWAADGPVCSGSTTASCTASGSIKVIDLKSRTTKQVIYINPNNPPPSLAPVHGRVDELCFNHDSNVVLGASNAFSAFGDRFLSFIDAHSFNIVGTIRLDGTDPAATDPDDPLHTKIAAVGGAIEQCQANPRDGKFYLSIPKIDNNNGAVLRISGTQPFQVEKVFKIPASTGCGAVFAPPASPAGPAGLTIGPDHQILAGCNGSSTQSVIIDDRDNNRPYLYVPTTSGVDEVWFDRGSNHYYLAQAAATPAIMGVEDAGHEKTLPNPDPNASTQTGSKNPAADPERNFVYLPVLALKTVAGGICNTTKDVNGKFGSDLQGCIAIYSAPLDRDDRGGGDEQSRAGK